MKLEDCNIAVKRYGEIKETDFYIADINLLLEYMRKSIYSNPIKVLCQEIMSNARDAHREVGREDIPIQIKLPNAFESTWECRDFGPGIDPERMNLVFKGFGASTKTSDNSQTGGFGIGSKTPWAYTDTFIVSTIANENGKLIKREYTCVLMEDRSCRLVEFDDGREITQDDPIEDQQTGTIIIVNVEPKDFTSFEKYTREVSLFWKLSPIIKGKEYKNSKDHYIESEENDFIVMKNRLYSKELILDTFCLVDEIPYPIHYESCNISDDIKRYILNKSLDIVLKFKTGDISLAISREQIQYDNKTKKLINKKIKDTMTSLIQKTQKEIDNCKNLWEAQCLLYKIKYKFEGLSANLFTYKNKIIDSYTVDIEKILDKKYLLYSVKQFHKTDKRCRYKQNKNTIIPSESSILVLQDTKDRITERMREIFNQNQSIKSIYYLSIKDNSVDITKLDDYIYCKLSDVKIPGRPSNKNKKIGVYKLSLGQYYSYSKPYHKYIYVDPDDFTEICINAEEIECNHNQKLMHIKYISEFMGHVKIYSAAKTYYQKLKKAQRFDDLCKTLYKTISKKTKTNYIIHNISIKKLNLLDLLKQELTKDSYFLEYIKINSKISIPDSEILEYNLFKSLLFFDNNLNKEYREKIDKINGIIDNVYQDIRKIAPLLTLDVYYNDVTDVMKNDFLEYAKQKEVKIEKKTINEIKKIKCIMNGVLS